MVAVHARTLVTSQTYSMENGEDNHQVNLIKFSILNKKYVGFIKALNKKS
jgi:hypothetical protein